MESCGEDNFVWDMIVRRADRDRLLTSSRHKLLVENVHADVAEMKNPLSMRFLDSCRQKQVRYRLQQACRVPCYVIDQPGVHVHPFTDSVPLRWLYPLSNSCQDVSIDFQLLNCVLFFLPFLRCPVILPQRPWFHNERGLSQFSKNGDRSATEVR
jgi:hypothetical protein